MYLPASIVWVETTHRLGRETEDIPPLELMNFDIQQIHFASGFVMNSRAEDEAITDLQIADSGFFRSTRVSYL